jgi:membrane protease subunit (stomatin/prohibitin family)
MNHQPIANAQAFEHIQAARPKLRQALTHLKGTALAACGLQSGMGQVLSASRSLKRALQANAAASASAPSCQGRA